MRSCKGISLIILVLIFFAITIHSKKKPPSKTKTRSRAAAVLSQSDCGPTESYHNESDKCIVTGTQGSCPVLMTFYADTETEGFGDCDCDEGDCSQGLYYLYWIPESRCYPAFEQGPCGEGEWLTENSITGDVECQKNPCINGMEFDLTSDNEDIRNGTWSSFVDENGNLLKGMCVCLSMSMTNSSSSDSGQIDNNFTSTSVAPTNAVSLRVTKSDLNCSCSNFEFQISNSTANTLEIFLSYKHAFSYCKILYLPVLLIIFSKFGDFMS